jgi:hypothetical protein
MTIELANEHGVFGEMESIIDLVGRSFTSRTWIPIAPHNPLAFVSTNIVFNAADEC